MTPFDFVRLAYALAVVCTVIAFIVAFARGDGRRGSGIWGPRHWFAVVAIVIGVVFLYAGCAPTQPTPVATTPPPPACSVTVTVNGDGSVSVNGCGNVTTAPSPTTSPSPTDTFICADAHAFIASFGWTGPSTSVRPNNQAQPYTLCKDCTSMLTGTLKKPTGDAPLNESSGRGRPEWTVDPLGVVDITTDPAQTNNVDGYNLLVKPTGAVGSTATVKLKFNASCTGDPVKGEFKYVISAN